MPNNTYRGELDGLRYDWHAIAKLIDTFGNDWDVKFTEAAATMNTEVIAQFVAIGSDATVDDVMKASPPITPTIGAITQALNLAFHGTKEAPHVEADENPPMMTEGTWWSRLVALLSKLV